MDSTISKANTSSHYRNEKLFDVTQAGLDPLISVFFRFFIKDVIRLQELHTDNTGLAFPVFTYNGHLVSRVDIIGTVVMVDIRDKKHSYGLDDGTGVILCNFWPKRESDVETDTDTSQWRNLPESLQGKLNQIQSDKDCLTNGFSVADVVRIRGGVGLHQGRKEINILSAQNVGAPIVEIKRILQLPQFYSSYYDKPFVPPAIKTEGQDQESGSSAAGDSVDTVTKALLSYLESGTTIIDCFSCDDVFKWTFLPKSSGKLDKTTVKASLETISKTSGLVICLSCGEDQYELVKPGSRLSCAVMDIIHQACRYEEKGCHMTHIHKKLSQSSRYATIDKVVLQKVLHFLELDSEIISVSSDRFMSIT